MRYWQFGIFDAQAADFNGIFIGGARSILSLENDSTNQVSATNNWNPTGESGSASLGYQTGDSEPIHYYALVEIDIGQIKAKLGQIPVLVKTYFTTLANVSSATTRLRVYRMYTMWDNSDTNSRYRDVSATETWYEDTYSPYPSQDRASSPAFESDNLTWTTSERALWDVTDLVTLALRDNISCKWMLWPKGNQYYAIDWKPSDTSRRPTLEFYYLYPIEFYEDSGGVLNYAATIQEEEDGHYYIGAVERGQTGSAVKCWIRNYSGETQHVELFDDHPEWTTPYQSSGTGTGQLDYVTLADNAVSQKYEPVFYSATQYEVRATAYRDNATSLHPTINADASWRGSVSSDFTAPSGGLTIPAAAWQPGTVLDDEFDIGVRGNTTDSSWPADSNDQVEMTYDNAGSADASGWRPVLGRRELSTNTVAVDSTSKFFPVRHLATADWPVGVPCFIQSQDYIDEGVITSAQVRALGSDTFTGSGTDDLVAPTGNYNGNANRTYRLQIDANGTPDTFSWSRDGSTSWVATGVDVQSTSFELEDGIFIYWSATTGHTIGDYWTFDADTWGVTVGSLSAGSNSYAAGSVVGTTLPLRSVTAAVYSQVSAPSGVSETPSSRIYLDDTTGFTAGDDLFIQQTGNPDVYEYVTIDTSGVHTGYVDLTTSLTNDYDDGDFCTKTDAGERAFWVRPVAGIATVEELKRLRINARML